MSYKSLIKKAERHYNAHEYSQAIDCAMQAIESDSTKVDGYYWQGIAYEKIRAEDDMQKNADALLVCTPSTALHYAYRGWAYNAKKEPEKAVTECSEALQQDVSVKEAYLYRASAYCDLNEFDSAISDCNEAINLAPKWAVAYSSRGDVYYHKGDYDNAIEDYSRVIGLATQNSEAYDDRGCAYFKKGDYDRAIEDFNRAVKIDPNKATAYSGRGNVYNSKGDFDLAIRDYDKAIEINPKLAVAYYNRGNTYYYKDDYDQAIENYNEVIKLVPNFAPAHINRGNVYKMKLVGIRNNRQYVDELKYDIKKVVPFLGAGVSIPYGYFSWKDLLFKLVETCFRVQEEVSVEKRKEIENDIDAGRYVKAASEMDKIFANLSSTACTAISRVAQKNPITVENKGVLGEYLHLFPARTYLTTNYDQVIENILRLRFPDVSAIIATKLSYGRPGLRSSSSDKSGKESRSNPFGIPTVYYLHGIFTERDIILSDAHYNDYYGSEGDIKSSLRRSLPKKLFELHNDYRFLYVGCSMTIKEDRILKLLREFYSSLQSSSYSYAFLSVNTVTSNNTPISKWSSLSKELQEQMSLVLDEKEDELENMNVRVIWYSATTDEERESAKKALFDYILGGQREEWEINLQKWRAESKEQEEREQVEIEKMKNAEVVDKFAFPKKYFKGLNYEFSVIKIEERYYISDQGRTYEMLEPVFELKEPDVVKNLAAIAKECAVDNIGNYLRVEIKKWDDDKEKEVQIEEAKYRLFSCVSFMDTMRIFYV